MSGATVQRRLAEFVASAPAGWAMPGAAPVIRQAWLDTFAVSVAGWSSHVSTSVRAYRDSIVAPSATLTRSCSPDLAALVDAVTAHALDYDDVAPAWRGHPSCVLFPVLTALGSLKDLTGNDVVNAYAVGFEVGARLGEALAGRHYEKGWHATSTIGVVAAAAAGSRLLGLSAAASCNAIGLALTQASGLQAAFGSDAKALQAGFAAAGAVRACLLAANGVGCTDSVLDGPKGFLDLYTDGWSNAEALDRLGQVTPAIVELGIEVKLYPICYAAHRAIEAALQLRTEVGPELAAIAAIEIEGSPGAHTPLLTRLPTNAQEALFSVEYGVATALCDGAVRLGSFSDEMRDRAEIQSLMAHSRAYEVAHKGPFRSATVRLRLADGTVHERAVGRAASGPPVPGAFAAKVNDCLSAAGVAHESRAVSELFAGDLGVPVRRMLASGPHERILQWFAARDAAPQHQWSPRNA